MITFFWSFQKMSVYDRKETQALEAGSEKLIFMY